MVVVVDSAGITINREIGTAITDTTLVLPGYYDSSNVKVIAYDSEGDSSTWANRSTYTAYHYLYMGQAGGLIFYDKGSYSNGWRYLEAAPFDQSTDAEWGCDETTIAGADGTSLGTGPQNAIDIVNGCTTAGIAADICANLDLNGHNDWFLPSNDELDFMCQNLHGIGGFSPHHYWSSTENTPHIAWYVDFSFCELNGWARTNNVSVRAVRAF